MNPRFLRVSALALLVLSFSCAFARAQGYPPVVAPPENPITEAKRVLGKILFWDEQLSSDSSTACGTCHIPSAGGSDPRSLDFDSKHPGFDGILNSGDDTVGSKGVTNAAFGGDLVDDLVFFPNARVTDRKSPSFMDAMFFRENFWDGRATSAFVDPISGQTVIASGGSLESQAIGPILNDVEMAHGGRFWADVNFKIDRVDPLRLATNIPADVAAALAVNPTYPALFLAAFGAPAPGETMISPKRIAMAIATYERTLTSNMTPFDDFNAGNAAALTPAQQNGKVLFETSANCAICHFGPMFSAEADAGLAASGLGFRNVGFTNPFTDPGRFNVTGDPQDLGKFKVPGLRNVGLRETTGLFHTGSGQGTSLGTVVSFYNTGGTFFDNIDFAMFPMNLSATEVADIADFLREGLTDPRVENELFPFDRPTLRSEIDAQQNPVTSSRFTYGFGLPDSDGNVPQMVIPGPPHVEQSYFTIGVAGAKGGETAVLVAGDVEPTGFSFEVPFPIFIQTNANLATVSQPLLGGSGPGQGYASFTVGLPDNPGLAGYQIAVQWFVSDALAPFGLSSSEAVILRILG